jgi:protease I
MKKAVVLIANDYQDLEVWYPILRLREAGWKVVTAGVDTQEKYKGKYGYPITVDTTVEAVRPEDFDCVIIPGGWAPDKIRTNRSALDLVATMNSKQKAIAAICHAGWVLVSAKVLTGKRCTSYSAIKDDLVNAGAHWVDEEVVVDGNLITSRTPDDLPAFCRAILETVGA